MSKLESDDPCPSSRGKVAPEKITISGHARRQAQRRGIDEATVLQVAQAPEQIIPLGADREARQSQVPFPPKNKKFLVRVFVAKGAGQATVLTAYRTSRIKKYWRAP